jgi:hypothetical protein
MRKGDLAIALGISTEMVRKLAKRGMPTHTIEAAKSWRGKNLEPVRTKQYRADGNQGGMKTAAGKPATAAVSFDSLIRERLPALLFQPLGIAALMRDAGLPVNGQQALSLADYLFMYYATLIDPGGEQLQFVVPEYLQHDPGTPEHAAVAMDIDEFLASL